MFERINIFISLIAGIVYTVFAIVNQLSLVLWLPNIIIVLALFFILGSLFKKYIKRNVIDLFEDEDDFSQEEDEFEEDLESNVGGKTIFDDLEDE